MLFTSWENGVLHKTE